MKVSKLKLGFIVLSIATIVWVIADYQSHYKLLEKSTDNPILRLMGYFWGYRSGQGIFLSGGLLLITWVIFIDQTLGQSISAFVADIKRAFQNKKGS